MTPNERPNRWPNRRANANEKLFQTNEDMTTISTFAVTRMDDGTIAVNDAAISVEFRQGFGIHVSGLDGFPAREILLRTIKALASSGCIVGNRKISTKVNTSDELPRERHYVMTELFDFPLAVAIMNELGHAKFETNDAHRYLGMLRPDGRIELLGDGVMDACKARARTIGGFFFSANTMWKLCKVDPGHVYLTTFRRNFNLAATENSERG